MSAFSEFFVSRVDTGLTPPQVIDPDDPREQIEVGVLMANGRLAPRSFTSVSEAEAWAQPGEQVVQWNAICGCDR